MTAPWTPAPDAVVLALVRHGRTAWNAERRFLGRTDLPLDACGEAQADALGASCPARFHRVYASPLARAHTTAARLAAGCAHLPEVVVVPDVVEMAQGELEGKGRAELLGEHQDFFQRWTADSAETCPPGGESLSATRDRAMPALRGVASRHAPGEVIAVVTHQMVIASVTCTLAEGSLTAWRTYGIPNAAITWLAWDGSQFSIRQRGWRTPEVEAVEARFATPGGTL